MPKNQRRKRAVIYRNLRDNKKSPCQNTKTTHKNPKQPCQTQSLSRTRARSALPENRAWHQTAGHFHEPQKHQMHVPSSAAQEGLQVCLVSLGELNSFSNTGPRLAALTDFPSLFSGSSAVLVGSLLPEKPQHAAALQLHLACCWLQDQRWQE